MAAKKTTKVEKTPVSSAQEEKLKALETILYGSETAAAHLPLPTELVTILGESA